MTVSDYASGEVRAQVARQQLTMTGLAIAVGLPYQSVYNRLNGVTPWRLDELATAADWLGIPLARLIPPAA